MLRRTFLQLIPIGALFGLPRVRSRRAKVDQAVECARCFFRLIKSARASDLAKEFDPGTLAKFAELIRERMERAVAAGERDQVLDFYRVKRLETVLGWPPQRLFAEFLGGLRRVAPELFQVLSKVEMEVIGRVEEGADRVHVVYRLVGDESAEFMTAIRPFVVSFQLLPDGWALRMRQEVEGFEAAATGGFPDFTGSEVAYIGEFLGPEPDVRVVVARWTIRAVQGSVHTVGATIIRPDDPEWPLLARGDGIAAALSLNERYGLGPRPSTQNRDEAAGEA